MALRRTASSSSSRSALSLILDGSTDSDLNSLPDGWEAELDKLDAHNLDTHKHSSRSGRSSSTPSADAEAWTPNQDQQETPESATATPALVTCASWSPAAVSSPSRQARSRQSLGSAGGGGRKGDGANGKAGSSGSLRRRAAFVAGSISSLSCKPGNKSLSARDILLPRLPGPALDLIIPALPPATRAALRCCCRQFRAIVDVHTTALTLRPDRRAADQLKSRGTTAFSLFPGLRHATVILAGSCSGATGPPSAHTSASASTSTVSALQGPAYAAPNAANAPPYSARGRRTASSSAFPAAQPGPASPLLPLGGWLVVCGTANRLTSLSLHVGDVALLEDLAMSITHPQLQRLELHIGRSGSAHASPPLLQFVVSTLSGLRHLAMRWAADPDAADVAGGFDSCSGIGHVSSQIAGRAASVSIRGGGVDASGSAVAVQLPQQQHNGRNGRRSQQHQQQRSQFYHHYQYHSGGSRQLFLDGRPRLGPLLLASLGDLEHLESLELQGFLIDKEGHAMMTRHWPALVGRLQRLSFTRLHLMVPANTPPEQQLCGLLCGCGQLRELRADLRLPSAAGVAGGAVAVAAAAVAALAGEAAAADGQDGGDAGGDGGADGGGAAASLLLSLMHAARDVQAVRLEVLPVCLTRLALPGLVLSGREELQPLGRLRALTRLEVTALGTGASEYLPVLQELRLVECSWRQLLDMLPWDTAKTGAPGVVLSRESSSVVAVAAAAAARGRVVAWGAPEGEQQHGSAGAGGSSSSGGQALTVPGASVGVCGRDGQDTCGQLRLLEAAVCERLSEWRAADRGLLVGLARGLLPLAEADCRIRIRVPKDTMLRWPWDDTCCDDEPWEATAVWRHIKAAQNLRRLQAETTALATRLARGRLLQAERRRDKERQFVDR